MAIFVSMFRPLIDRFFPILGSFYRTWRDTQSQLRRFKVTPYGFKFAGNNAMETGNFELKETEILIKSLADTDVFIDVGANVGFYTCLSRSLGKKTIAFEPLYQNLRYLYRNLAENSWDDVEVYPVGLSDRPGIVALYGAGTGASLIKGWAGSSESISQMIPTSTMDIILQKRFVGKRLTIKLDVEGVELAVLNGALGILQQSPRPFWLLEIDLDKHHPKGRNPYFIQVFETFWRYGYEARSLTNTKIQPEQLKSSVRDGTYQEEYYNYVFL